MKEKVLFDAHLDTIEVLLDKNENIMNPSYAFNLSDASNHTPCIACLASYIHSRYEKNGAYDRANAIIDKFYEEYEKNKDSMVLIQTNKEIEEVIQKKKIGAILTIENAICIEENLQNIDYFYQRGVRMVSLTWNDDNHLGSGAYTQNDKGLTDFGKKCIKHMNQLPILIDVSHASMKSFEDIEVLAQKPIIASHSCCYDLCENNRNLKNEQIKKIASAGGVIGICFYKDFLTNNAYAPMDDMIDHIEYIADLVGIDFVGIGSDFEGVEKEELPVDLKGIKDIKKLEERLEERGFSKNEIMKVLGNNFCRIFQTVI